LDRLPVAGGVGQLVGFGSHGPVGDLEPEFPPGDAEGEGEVSRLGIGGLFLLDAVDDVDPLDPVIEDDLLADLGIAERLGRDDETRGARPAQPRRARGRDWRIAVELGFPRPCR